MAKKATPKKRQPRSSSSSRYKTFQKKAQKKLMNMTISVLKLKKLGKLTKPEKRSEDKITKVKA